MMKIEDILGQYSYETLMLIDKMLDDGIEILPIIKFNYDEKCMEGILSIWLNGFDIEIFKEKKYEFLEIVRMEKKLLSDRDGSLSLGNRYRGFYRKFINNLFEDMLRKEEKKMDNGMVVHSITEKTRCKKLDNSL